MTKILGIDEAGRGPVIGPLVVCGALIDEGKIGDLIALEVKDSKKLTPKRREILEPQIIAALDNYQIEKISAAEIDALRIVQHVNLNDIEAQTMASIINDLEPDKAYIDCVDTNILTFKARLSKHIHTNTEIITKHKADDIYAIVSAASILAKVERDRSIKKLHEEYGDFGSGYPSDPRTKDFLTQWIKEHDTYPPIVRKSWGTVVDALGQKKQKNLGDYA